MIETYSIVTPPTDEPVALADAKAHLRVTSSIDDARINQLITAAREDVEDRTGRAIMSQEWLLQLDEWPDRPTEAFLSRPYHRRALELRGGPVSALTYVKYLDSNGTDTTLVAGTDYQLDTTDLPARAWPAYGTSWPSARCQPGSIRARYTVGWVNAGAVPQKVKLAILLIVEEKFDGRDTRAEVESLLSTLKTTFA